MDLNQVYSDLILLQNQEKKNDFDLRTNAPLLSFLHPKMLKAILENMMSPEKAPAPIEIPNWFYDSFSHIQDAQNTFPQSNSYQGNPAAIGNFINSSEEQALFDFSPYGAFVLSRVPLSSSSPIGFHSYVIPPFLGYALSPELWGPQGKWVRFHERLHTLFEKYNLLKGDDYPGLYPLREEARLLEEFDIQGTSLEDSYILTLPWTFPLSALEKLEAIISQEF